MLSDAICSLRPVFLRPCPETGGASFLDGSQVSDERYHELSHRLYLALKRRMLLHPRYRDLPYPEFGVALNERFRTFVVAWDLKQPPAPEAALPPAA